MAATFDWKRSLPVSIEEGKTLGSGSFGAWDGWIVIVYGHSRSLLSIEHGAGTRKCRCPADKSKYTLSYSSRQDFEFDVIHDFIFHAKADRRFRPWYLRGHFCMHHMALAICGRRSIHPLCHFPDASRNGAVSGHCGYQHAGSICRRLAGGASVWQRLTGLENLRFCVNGVGNRSCRSHCAALRLVCGDLCWRFIHADSWARWSGTSRRARPYDECPAAGCRGASVLCTAKQQLGGHGILRPVVRMRFHHQADSHSAGICSALDADRRSASCSLRPFWPTQSAELPACWSRCY